MKTMLAWNDLSLAYPTKSPLRSATTKDKRTASRIAINTQDKRNLLFFSFSNDIENAGFDPHVSYASNRNHIHTKKCEAI
jgi:hypothetical protein